MWRLLDNKSVKEFKGTIQIREPRTSNLLPPVIEPNRHPKPIKWIIAIDSSTVTHKVQNGFPKAEAALFNAAVIVINLEGLRNIGRDDIPSPSQLRELEKISTMSCVLPGPNVIGNKPEQDTPKKFFRHTVRHELNFKLDPSHESLFETYLNITSDRLIKDAKFRCPIEDCEERIPRPTADTCCNCPRREMIYPTDSLRMHERFYDYSSSEQAFTAFRMVTEHLMMVNILRYFYKHQPNRWFDDIAFIVDGPLAIFGMPAWLKDHIQVEVANIHNSLIEQGQLGLFLMGMEKTGNFMDHLEELDWSQKEGTRQKLRNGTVLVPTTDYIYRNITPNPNSDKAYGQAVYYGRKVLYKNRTGQHAVIMTPIVNSAGREPNSTSVIAFPRLATALDITDDLYTYLYQDGFIPLVRANAHAAIPLRQGQQILANLFNDIN